MAGMYEQFKTSSDLEKSEGVWLDYGEFRVRVLRAGGSNKAYQKALDRAAKPHRKALALGAMDEATGAKIMVDVFVQHVIVGWQCMGEDGNWVDGIHSPTGTIEEANRDSIGKALRDLPDLFWDIRASAQNQALFRESIREANAGN